MFNKSCWWLDSNPGPLVLEATTLPTVPQPLPTYLNVMLSLSSVQWVYLEDQSRWEVEDDLRSWLNKNGKFHASKEILFIRKAPTTIISLCLKQWRFIFLKRFDSNKRNAKFPLNLFCVFSRELDLMYKHLFF